jgi:acetyl-CoA acetyltransferase
MGDALSTISVVELGSIVIKEILKWAGIAKGQVDHVYMGYVF